MVVGLCGFCSQLIKALAYSLTQRRFSFGVLAQTYGLPSLPATLLTCLMIMTGLRAGWSSGEFGFSMIFAVIVIHDVVRVRAAASEQRQAIFRLVETLKDAGPFHLKVAEFLDIRTHHPLHVGYGVVFGALFALAFGIPSG
jgi:acid phosphatase family membrane protein YuiD